MANCPPLKSCCSRCLASLLSFGMPADGLRGGGGAQPPLQPCANGGGRTPSRRRRVAGRRHCLGGRGGGRSRPALRRARKWRPRGSVPFLGRRPCAYVFMFTGAVKVWALFAHRLWRLGSAFCSWGQWRREERQQSEVRQQSREAHQMLLEASEKNCCCAWKRNMSCCKTLLLFETWLSSSPHLHLKMKMKCYI